LQKNFKKEKKFAKNKNLKIAKNRAVKTKIWYFLEKFWHEKFLEICEKNNFTKKILKKNREKKI